MNSQSNFNTPYPVFGRNVNLENFYKSKSPNRSFSPKRKYSPKDIITVSVFFLFLALLPASVYLSQRGPGLTGLAGTEEKTANLFLYPDQVTEDSGSSFTVEPKLVGPDGKKIATVQVAVGFDRNKLQVASLQTSDLPDNMQYLKSSSLQDANASGKIRVLVGAQDETNAPEKVVNLPRISFFVKEKGDSRITIDGGESQVVFTGGEPAEVKVSSEISVK